jgi:hypothetical protein
MDGDNTAALAKLTLAAAQAQEGSWINDVALAHELCANCHPEPDDARRSLRSARTGYAAWGATAKVKQLSQRIAALGT